ncbi:unnamed protein product [Rhodiola kirilowii]
MWHQLEPWSTATENLNRPQRSHMKLQLIHKLVSGWHHPLQLSPLCCYLLPLATFKEKTPATMRDSLESGGISDYLGTIIA